MSLSKLAGSTTDNSYLSVAEGDAIAATMLGTLNWTSATPTNKEAALIQATLQLDTLGWIGSKALSTQPLQWPRDGAKCGDKDYTKTVIPRELELATFDLAEALLGNPGLITGLGSAGATSSAGELVPGVPNKDLKSLTLDVMRLEWRDNATGGGSTIKTPLTVLPHLSSILGCLTTSSVGGCQLVSRVRS
ncbi:MAG: DnaT-like ssDNA-binding protein [Limnohabitans sp.]